MTSSVTDQTQRERSAAFNADAGSIEFAEHTEDNATTPTSVPSGAVPPPAWFRAKASKAASIREPELNVIAKTPEVGEVILDLGLANDAEPKQTKKSASGFPIIRPQRRRKTTTESDVSSAVEFWTWLKSSAGSACGASLLAHIFLIVVMSFVAFGSRTSPEPFSTILSEPEGDYAPIQFTGVTDLSEVASGGSKTLNAALTDLNADSLRPTATPELSANAARLAGGKGGDGDGAGMGDNEGDGFGDGEGFLFKMPKGGKAVLKGSFSAWTVPEDPSPGETYMIVIRIKLPAEAKLFRVSDVVGSVTGTDNFSLLIPFDKQRPGLTVTERKGNVVAVKVGEYLPIVDGHVQLMVKVPGAAQAVRDTIEIKSKLLKESQRLELVF